jgi:hypothetical protein
MAPLTALYVGAGGRPTRHAQCSTSSISNKYTHKKTKPIITLAGMNKAYSKCTQGNTAKQCAKQLAVLCKPLFHQGQFFERVAVSSCQLPNLKRIDNGGYAL